MVQILPINTILKNLTASSNPPDSGSNLTNKYNPQEPFFLSSNGTMCSNLTNKYNPQEQPMKSLGKLCCSNLTNKYNPQEPDILPVEPCSVQILPINTILKNAILGHVGMKMVQILPINTILKNRLSVFTFNSLFKSYQ